MPISFEIDKHIIVFTIDTVNNVNQKLNNVPPSIDSHMEPGIEKLCRLNIVDWIGQYRSDNYKYQPNMKLTIYK